ncbi:MAG: hypothetical protein NZ518_03680, partial [Dehalococcoidia bacterium]|nr:hypothetical protein [Dehalococcoidia bacterium]
MQRTLLAGLGLTAVVVGLFVVPPITPPSWQPWAGQAVTAIGWAGLMLAIGAGVWRLIVPAVFLSSVLAIALGFAVIFGLPLIGDPVPRTIGLVSVLLGGLTVGWTVLRGVSRLTVTLTGALAVAAIFAQIAVWVTAFFLSTTITPTTEA